MNATEIIKAIEALTDLLQYKNEFQFSKKEIREIKDGIMHLVGLL